MAHLLSSETCLHSDANLHKRGRGSLLARSSRRRSQYLSSCLPAQLVVSLDRPELGQGRTAARATSPDPASPPLFASLPVVAAPPGQKSRRQEPTAKAVTEVRARSPTSPGPRRRGLGEAPQEPGLPPRKTGRHARRSTAGASCYSRRGQSQSPRSFSLKLDAREWDRGSRPVDFEV